jgi:hypothetical protein
MDPDVDVALLIRAIDFAARKHRLQRRKDVEASPYINYPVALMSVLCVEAGVCDVEVLSAAALHDTIEDTQTTRDEISREFGKKIADIVAEVTDDKSLPTKERKRLQIDLKSAAEKSRSVACDDGGQDRKSERHSGKHSIGLGPGTATGINPASPELAPSEAPSSATAMRLLPSDSSVSSPLAIQE